METNYNGKLVMPANYAVVDDDEMMYVDGGWCIENHWWGCNVYFTKDETILVCTGHKVLSSIAGPVLGWGSKAISLIYEAVIAYRGRNNGVRLRVTGIFFNPMVTGVYALSASEEQNKAASNRIIW